MKHFFTSLALLLPALIFAQDYATPGTGMAVDLDYLVENSDGYVTLVGDLYQINDSITISAGDTLFITSGQTIGLDSAVLVTIAGSFETSGGYFTNIGENLYNGFRFEEGSHILLTGTTFEYGGGLRVLTEDFNMYDCIVRYNSNIVSSGGAVGLSSGTSVFSGCTFLENAAPAISSAANSIVAPYITDCVFTGNNTDNENRPQINISTSGPADTTFVLNSTIEGYEAHDRAGAIAFSDMLGVATGHIVLENNTIINNRYGIYVYGNDMHARIVGNTITDNNNESNPLAGGSGILIQGNEETTAYIAENVISGNLWGVNALGAPFVNLGDTAEATFNPGGNVFFDNGNGGITYTFYNNTPNDQTAMNNCWNGEEELTPAEAEDLIFHSVDDNTLGTVTYLPLGCISIGVEEQAIDPIAKVYPNPASTGLTIEVAHGIQNIELRDVSGALVLQVEVGNSRKVSLPLANVPAGIYFITTADHSSPAQKVIVVR